MRNKLGIIGIFLLIAALFVLFTLAAYSVNGQDNIVASGGQFSLEKSAVAGGGNQMQQAQVSAGGTAGQGAAGVRSTGGQFTLYSGFWTPRNFSPTAGEATVSGRITTAGGNGIRNVVVRISSSTGEIGSTLSSSMGYYQFTGIPAGAAYSISVSAKRYRFGQPVKIVNISGDTEDIDFTANTPEQ